MCNRVLQLSDIGFQTLCAHVCVRACARVYVCVCCRINTGGKIKLQAGTETTQRSCSKLCSLALMLSV